MNEILEQLNERFIPFWASMKDDAGGFFGCFQNGVVNRDANRGAIMHLECLWFFSRAFQTTHDPKLKELADHAYRYVKDVFIDKSYGGMFYAVRPDGTAIDRTKHALVAAKALYAFTAYFDCSKDYTALKNAYESFNLLEIRHRRDFGYQEQFDNYFLPDDNTKMCDGNGTRHVRTMLCILEAYVDFFAKTRDEKVKDGINFLFELLKYRVYDEKTASLEVYLDDELSSDYDVFDVGLNMHGSWVMTNAALTMGDFTREDVTMIKRLVETSVKEGWDGDSMIYRKYGKKLDTDRLSWVQAETIIAFLNAYNVTDGDVYLERAKTLWCFIKEKLAVTGGWYYGVSKEGKVLNKPVANIDNGPLCVGRMFLEVLRRNINIGL